MPWKVLSLIFALLLFSLALVVNLPPIRGELARAMLRPDGQYALQFGYKTMGRIEEYERQKAGAAGDVRE